MAEPAFRTAVLTPADARAAFARRAPSTAELTARAPDLALACRAMADRFRRGGRLLAVGAAADAAHVVVEFVHPVIVGKRALPALALGDPARLPLFAEPGDIALAIAPDGGDAPLARALADARGAGLLTVALLGGGPGRVTPSAVDHHLAVAAGDARLVREAHVTAYHVLWELVHVFLETPGGP
jgi:D-sedoheptulose 7-phosphate isomerase